MSSLSAIFQHIVMFFLYSLSSVGWDPAEKWDIDLGDLLQYVDVFIPNIAELKAMAGTSDFDIAIKSVMHSKAITVIIDGN